MRSGGVMINAFVSRDGIAFFMYKINVELDLASGSCTFYA
jgi:hypothetical protein